MKHAQDGFDFTRGVDRRGSDSLKWERYVGRDIIPLWVADMDFAAPPPVLDALRQRIEHGVFGYAKPWPSLTEAVQQHVLRHYAWAIEAPWIVWIPGVVAALNLACRSVGDTGDAVLSATPVYPPFLAAPAHSARRLETVALQRNAVRWQWDFAAVDAAFARSQAKLWLLCHPHNPVGRVWDDEELNAIAALAEKHDAVVCSDEVHCGLVLDPTRRHRPLAALSESIAQRSITLMAPSKTFNVPGLYSAFAVIPDATLRRRFLSTMEGIMPHINTLGLVATEAAYRDGDDWQRALLDTLRGNAQRVEQAVTMMPGLRTTPMEATYLAWIDCSGLGLDHPQKFFEQAGVGLSDGRDFGLGADYQKYVRLNFGCPAGTLETALARMASAVAQRTKQPK
ncbi:MAG: PatB family C-S lyase [Rhodocyclaceae bacterium]|nr:PatB family C-S lyase [Rhodocyclaceae bacterium]